MAEPLVLRMGPQGQVQYTLLMDNAAAFSFEQAYRREFPGKEKGLFEFYSECAACVQAVQAGEKGQWARIPTPTLTELSIALWALAHHHSKGRPSLEKIRGEMEPGKVLEYVSYAAGAIMAGMPWAKPAEGEEPKGEAGARPLDSTPSSSA